MSIEQRVTDAMVADVIEGITEYHDTGGSHFVEDDIWLDLRDSRAALRETEAKLRDALAEVERLADINRKLCRDFNAMNNCQAQLENRATTAESALAVTKAKLEAAEKALCEAEETLRLVERPAFPDPVHHERVKALGREIGFGALMSTASAGWREAVEEKGWPGGGEFVAGPCLATVQAALKTIRAALTTKETTDAN